MHDGFAKVVKFRRKATNKFVSFRNFSTLAVLISLFLSGLWDLNISEDGTHIDSQQY